VRARRALAPYLRRPEIAYTALVVAYLLLLWWRPTPQFGFPRTVVVWFLIAVLSLEVQRRQAAREFPDAEPADLLASLRSTTAGLRERPGEAATAGELERLARLHADGSLDGAEFATAKARVLGPPVAR
jgi:hypothetical protein